MFESVREHGPKRLQWLVVGAFALWGASSTPGMVETISGALFAVLTAYFIIRAWNVRRA